MTRGIRNNNPLNLELGAQWQGLREEQTDGRFCQFVAPEWGIRAAVKILLTYGKKYGLNTVRKIIFRWAPPSENDTESYIKVVAKGVGVASDDALDQSDPQVLLPLLKAMIRQENGKQPYDDATLEKAMALADIKI